MQKQSDFKIYLLWIVLVLSWFNVSDAAEALKLFIPMSCFYFEVDIKVQAKESIKQAKENWRICRRRNSNQSWFSVYLAAVGCY